MADVPQLLDAVALSGFDAFDDFAPIVKPWLFFHAIPANAFPHRLNMEGAQCGVIGV